MVSLEQLINETTRKKTALCYRRKGYRMTIIFVIWLAYSACVLGWFILNTPSGLHCANHF
jgi:hypothetical protein